MNRINIVQECINATQAKTYLEIGIERGNAMFSIKAPVKIGVDPVNRLKLKYKIKLLFGKERFQRYWVKSDIFFERHAHEMLSNGIDVAFVDGLHTHRQSLQDIENCLKYLNKNGIIVLHDCNPPDLAHAYPVKESYKEIKKLVRKNLIPGWEGGWSGDVWKTIVYLRTTRDDLSIFTIDSDSGIGIITRGKNTKLNILSAEKLKDADFSFLDKDRNNLLNLVSPEYFMDFIENYGQQK